MEEHGGDEKGSDSDIFHKEDQEDLSVVCMGGK